MKKKLNQFISGLNIISIAEDRKEVLNDISLAIAKQAQKSSKVQVNFICTHNSRRSQLCQAWAFVISKFYNLKNLQFYSGGTEETSVYPAVIKTLESNGCIINAEKNTSNTNPTYILKFDDNSEDLKLKSKLMDSELNPNSGFVAIMTCRQADEACPFVPGAEIRKVLEYIDPKFSDNSPEELVEYNKISKTIAREMKFLFSKLKFEYITSLN